ncbi:hypothetical protein [Rhizobium sp. BK060]|uniref:hypothetical protein n=1 Tax=Rhizobium sp. BK060 TaxID=2587096 RepID=UPI00160F43AC|nr:hypothetical protein [Rhizobium sp. BK060]MBB3395345.1 hypothetical protein [Rhizobium sp. BK060]
MEEKKPRRRAGQDKNLLLEEWRTVADRKGRSAASAAGCLVALDAWNVLLVLQHGNTRVVATNGGAQHCRSMPCQVAFLSL